MKLFDISIIVFLAPPLMKATSRHCSIQKKTLPLKIVRDVEEKKDDQLKTL